MRERERMRRLRPVLIGRLLPTKGGQEEEDTAADPIAEELRSNLNAVATVACGPVACGPVALCTHGMGRCAARPRRMRTSVYEGCRKRRGNATRMLDQLGRHKCPAAPSSSSLKQSTKEKAPKGARSVMSQQVFLQGDFVD